ncbi:uncharacterized protein TNCV_4512391 [Trichonephila clavipes]|nr:uncharacterized protein TNCV_4512391 [Trichonephila clavipes]
MRDKSRKETSSSKISANDPDKISVYDSDIKGQSKYIGPIKVLFDIPHHTFTDQHTWWRFGRTKCGCLRDQRRVRTYPRTSSAGIRKHEGVRRDKGIHL